MKVLLLVGTGSFIGGICRYLVSKYIRTQSDFVFPLETLVVNVLGCLIIGCIVAASERTTATLELRLFLATGFCGGFTTFSAFSIETLSLLRMGQLRYAIYYITCSLMFGILATFAGYWLLRSK